MKVCIAASAAQKSELQEKNITNNTIIQWVDDTTTLLRQPADLLIDCTFDGNSLSITDIPLLVHAPASTLPQLQAKGKVARFCAWNTFLKRNVWEIAVTDGTDAVWLCTIMNKLGWNILLTKDEPGLIAPRIISTIINEAYYTLQAGISTREEIDLAMKLGTNYPYGPFEWCAIIGKQEVKHLLQKLFEEKALYQPVML